MSRGWSLAAGLLACSLAAGACGATRQAAPSQRTGAAGAGDWASRVLRGMSMRQKAAQLVMPRVGGEYVPVGTGANMLRGPGQVLTGGVILPYGVENGEATRFPPLINNPANPIINTRTFGGDPALVARLGEAIGIGSGRAEK